MPRRLGVPTCLTLALMAGLLIGASPAQGDIYMVAYNNIWQDGGYVDAYVATGMWFDWWCSYYDPVECVWWYTVSVSGSLERDSEAVDSDWGDSEDYPVGVMLSDEIPSGTHTYSAAAFHEADWGYQTAWPYPYTYGEDSDSGYSDSPPLYADGGEGGGGGGGGSMSVEININDTPDNSDDITLLNPAQTVSAQIIAHGASGTVQLSVPSGKASIDQTTLSLTEEEPEYVTITPLQQSQAANDVEIVATYDSSQVGQAWMTIVDVGFPSPIRNQDTPEGMPDRIPPRVDTPIQVTVEPSLSGTNQKVTLVPLSTNSTNGEFTINGGSTQDIVQSGTVNLQGTTQTAATYDGNGGGNAGNLLVGVQVRGETVGWSSGFSVAAILQYYEMEFGWPVTDNGKVGMAVVLSFSSDSGSNSDLDAVAEKEKLELAPPYGWGVFQYPYYQESDYQNATWLIWDNHDVPGTFLHSPGGFYTMYQTHVFRDYRTGAVDIPAASSGYQIDFNCSLDSRTIYDLTVIKAGRSGSANNVTSEAGSTNPHEGVRCQSDHTGPCVPGNNF